MIRKAKKAFYRLQTDPTLFKKALKSLYRQGFKETLLKIKYNIYLHSENEKSFFLNKEEFQPLPLSQKKSDKTVKIAVIIHAFYLDVLEDIITLLDNISPKPTLFISISQDANQVEVEQFLHTKGYHQIHIVKVQNQGRDVAPFLIEFASKLQDYDLCCKVHGKKSLYSGSDRADWRGHLYYNLLGTKKIVDDIISRFSYDKKLGLLFSDNYGMLPYWGYTWLTNKPAVIYLLNRLKLLELSPLLQQTYIDYPAGTMFWFRPNAIKQILNNNLKYTDFPIEPIANDGTIAHGLERLFGYTSRLNGFDFIELNYKKGLYSKNFCHKNFNQLEAKTLQVAKDIAVEYEIILFDIFDTLLSRPIFYPDNLFVVLEQKLNSRFGIVSGFFGVRKEIEERIRSSKNGKGDVSYDEIYALMMKEKYYSQEIVEFLYQEEFNLELAILRPKFEVVELFEFLKQKGKKIYFVSDMYLTSKQIQRIFEKCKIDISDVEFFVSSQIGYRKDNGTMWRYLSERIDTKKALMFGDNEVSDAKLAGDFGITTFHLMSEKNIFFESPIGKAFREQFQGVDDISMVLLGPVIAKLFDSPFTFSSRLLQIKEPLSAYEFGYCALAPFFYLFMNHLYITHQNKRIYFLARDGYFLKEIFEHFVATKGLNLPKAPHYLLISRRAVLGAMRKNEKNLKELMVDLGHFDGWLSQLIETRLGLSSQFLDARGIKDFKIDNDSDLNRAYNLLKEHIDAINLSTKQEQESYLYYLKSIGFFDETQDVLVDLGYSGTIQNYLHQLSQKELIGEYFVTTNRVQKHQSPSNQFHGYFGNDIILGDYRNIIYRYSLVLESYLTSNQGQFVSFDEKNRPQFKSNAPSIETQIEITKGIKDYIYDLSIVGVEALDTQSLKVKELSSFLFGYVIQNRLIGSDVESILHLEDDFTGNAQLNILNIYQERGV